MIFLLPGHTPQLYKDKDILQGNRENLKKCGDDSGKTPFLPDPPISESDSPTATWAANPDFEPVVMQGDINGMFDIEFNVPGRIRTFGINVESDVLSEAFDALAIRKITGLFIAAVLPQS